MDINIENTKVTAISPVKIFFGSLPEIPKTLLAIQISSLVLEAASANINPPINKNIKELTFKLEKKSFEIAKQYYHTADYIAAIVAFDNLLSDYLGTSFREEAMYYKFKSAYELGINSFIAKKEDRIKDALKSHERFKRNYPKSDYLNETEKLVNNLTEELNSLLALKTEN